MYCTCDHQSSLWQIYAIQSWSDLQLGDHGLLEVEAGALSEQQALGQVLLIEGFEDVLPLEIPARDNAPGTGGGGRSKYGVCETRKHKKGNREKQRVQLPLDDYKPTFFTIERI